MGVCKISNIYGATYLVLFLKKGVSTLPSNAWILSKQTQHRFHVDVQRIATEQRQGEYDKSCVKKNVNKHEGLKNHIIFTNEMTQGCARFADLCANSYAPGLLFS